MFSFSSPPNSEDIIPLSPDTVLKYLYKYCDIEGADSRFDDPQKWHNSILFSALTLVGQTISYCSQNMDTHAVEQISQIDWKKTWSEGKGDIAADLNFIYHVATAEHPSSIQYDEEREKFFLSLSDFPVFENVNPHPLFELPPEIANTKQDVASILTPPPSSPEPPIPQVPKHQEPPSGNQEE